MAEIKEAYSRIHRTNTRVYALSVDSPEQSAALKKEMELPFNLLSDPDRKAVEAFDLLNPYEHGGIARPAVFVIRPSGVVGYRSLDSQVRRADMAHVIYYLETLARNPDYVLEVPFSAKEWTLPGPKTIRQVARNMVLRGNRADWEHYVFYPVEMMRKVTGEVLSRKDR